MRLRLRVLSFCFVSAVALMGCQNQQPVLDSTGKDVSALAQLTTVCNGLAGAYNTAAAFRAQKKLTDSQISILTQLEPVAKQNCNKANPPADINAAIASVTATTAQVSLMNAGVK